MLDTDIWIGEPKVLPSNTPDSISALSFSFLCVVISLCPGFLLFNSNCMSSFEILIPGGHPSIVTPTASPCDSPQVVILYDFPNVFGYLFLLIFIIK